MSYAMGLTQEVFERDQQTQDAIIYRLGVIGEAARFVSAGTQAEIPLQWPHIISMRHRLFHGYREVNLGIVWDTVLKDLPLLIEAVHRHLTS